MPAFRSLDDVALEGRKVLLRVDLNVPIENGVVRDATRIERVVPTIRELCDKGASVILLAHFDRPKGKVVPEMSLAPVAPALSQALGKQVRFVFTDWQDTKAEEAASALKPGDVILLENTRFAAGEETNDAALAEKMAKLGDLFVNDAFSAAHRAHASTEGVAHHVEAVAGRAIHHHLRLHDRHNACLLAQCGIAGECLRVGFHGTPCWQAISHVDDRAPFGKAGTQIVIFLQAGGEAIETLGDLFTGKARQIDRTLVHLDAGNGTGSLDHLGERGSVLGLLAQGFIIEDDAGDVVCHGVLGREQQFAVIAAAFFGGDQVDVVKALLDGAGAFICRQNALACRHHGAGNILKPFVHGIVLFSVHRALNIKGCYTRQCLAF